MINIIKIATYLKTEEKRLVKIGYRTIKTAIATPIAISIAQYIGVSNALSAGILTILCIQPSRKKSVESAWHRFLACILSIIFSFVFFELLGYNPIVLGLLLVVFIPTTVFLKIEQGILTSTVITLNLYTFGTINFSFLKDQFSLILIGIGVGLLVNLYMPSLEKQLIIKRRVLEKKFQKVLLEIALYIREENMDWNGKEINEIAEIFEETENLVERDRDNHLLRDVHSFEIYFGMRHEQYELLQRMLPLVTRLPKKYKTSESIANFFEELSEAVHPGNTADLFLEDLKELRAEFENNALPKTKIEFETRANLYQLLYDIEEYLIIKSKFKASDVTENPKKQKKTKKV